MTGFHSCASVMILNEVLSITAQELNNLVAQVMQAPILNEVLSITAQESEIKTWRSAGTDVLNEVLSITAQECGTPALRR